MRKSTHEPTRSSRGKGAGISESKKAFDSGSDDDEILQKKSDVPVSDRIKEAALHVLRSSKSLSIKSKDGPIAKPRSEASKATPTVSSASATNKQPATASSSSAFQPLKKPSKPTPGSSSSGNTHLSSNAASKLSVRERQRAYDEQVRKMNWKPLPVERPPPEPRPDRDAEIMKAAEREIFFPTTFGIPDDHPFPLPPPSLPSRRQDAVAETKSSSSPPLTIDTFQPPPRQSMPPKPIEPVTGAQVKYVPARRATKPVELPALLRVSMDANRKSFTKPKAVAAPKKEPTAKSKTLRAKGKAKKDASKPRKATTTATRRRPSDRVPEIRLSLSERLNTYLGSRDVSMLSGTTPAGVAEDLVGRPTTATTANGLRNSYHINPLARLAIEQSMAFGSDAMQQPQQRDTKRPAAEEKPPSQSQPPRSTSLSSRPPKAASTAAAAAVASASSKAFTRPAAAAAAAATRSSDEALAVQLNLPRTSTIHYDATDHDDDIDLLARLRPRGLHYRPYESDEESTGSLFRDEALRDPEFGVVQTILRKRQALDAEQQPQPPRRGRGSGKGKATAGGQKKHRGRDASPRRSSYESWDSSPSSSLGGTRTTTAAASAAAASVEAIDVDALKEKIKREILAEQADAQQAADDAWDEVMEKYAAPRRSGGSGSGSGSSRHAAPATVSSASAAGEHHDRRGDAHRLRLEIMDELRRQDELFQYTLELHELQNELVQQAAHPTVVLPPAAAPAATPATPAPVDPGAAAAAQNWLQEQTALSLQLLSTDQTLAESEQLLQLYRALQEQQARAAAEQWQQQQLATLVNLQTLPVLQDVHQSLELLAQRQELQQRQLQLQDRYLSASMSVAAAAPPAAAAAVGASAPSSPVRRSWRPPQQQQHEADTQTSPAKPASPQRQPPQSQPPQPQPQPHPTFPFYHYAYPSTADEETRFLGGPVGGSVGGGAGAGAGPAETALLRLQKVEQRQKERLAWLDHVIRMHLSTPGEADAERRQIDELHRVELEQLRSSLRESREKALRVTAAAGATVHRSSSWSVATLSESHRYSLSPDDDDVAHDDDSRSRSRHSDGDGDGDEDDEAVPEQASAAASVASDGDDSDSDERYALDDFEASKSTAATPAATVAATAAAQHFEASRSASQLRPTTTTAAAAAAAAPATVAAAAAAVERSGVSEYSVDDFDVEATVASEAPDGDSDGDGDEYTATFDTATATATALPPVAGPVPPAAVTTAAAAAAEESVAEDVDEAIDEAADASYAADFDRDTDEAAAFSFEPAPQPTQPAPPAAAEATAEASDEDGALLLDDDDAAAADAFNGGGGGGASLRQRLL
eukprot:gene17031-12190_t